MKSFVKIFVSFCSELYVYVIYHQESNKNKSELLLMKDYAKLTLKHIHKWYIYRQDTHMLHERIDLKENVHGTDNLMNIKLNSNVDDVLYCCCFMLVFFVEIKGSMTNCTNSINVNECRM